MVVCPACRRDNTEGAQFCNGCGRSLEPKPGAAIRPPERVGSIAFDIQPEPRRSSVPGIIGILVVALLIGGLGGWLAVRGRSNDGEGAGSAAVGVTSPTECVGKFNSTLYPYCMAIPEGWGGGRTRSGAGVIDHFTPTESEGAAIEVRAGQVFQGVDTVTYAQLLRAGHEASGFSTTTPVSIELADATAIAWDISADGEQSDVIRQRQVVVVRGAFSWRIVLVGNSERFEEAEPLFDGMLSTWGWRYVPEQLPPV